MENKCSNLTVVETLNFGPQTIVGLLSHLNHTAVVT